MNGIRGTEGSPRMTAGTGIRHAKTARPECAMDDAFVARAVERDCGVCIAAALREVMLGAPQIADAFFTGRRDEIDGAPWTKTPAVDLPSQREHYRQTAAVVVDPWTDEAIALTSNREIGVAGENRVEVRANDNWLEIGASLTPSDDIPGFVRMNLR